MAIIAPDIAGVSRLKGRNESGTEMRLFVSGALFGVLFAIACVSTARLADAQSSRRLPRIGVLNATNPCPPNKTFIDGLTSLGWIDGRTVIIDCVSVVGRLQELSERAAELVAHAPDVLVTGGNGPIRALMAATPTIPIVMAGSGDPVRDGLVASMSRPGGNVTGMTSSVRELQLKRVELLKEVVPSLTRLAVLGRSLNSPSVDRRYLEGVETELRKAANTFGFEYQWFAAETADDFPSVFKQIAAEKYDAVFLVAGPLLTAHQSLVGGLAYVTGLPTIGDHGPIVEAGALLSYGVHSDDVYRQTARFVDRILKGAKPSDLPVEEPSTFELAINLKTAKALGISVPPSILARATLVKDE